MPQSALQDKVNKNDTLIVAEQLEDLLKQIPLTESKLLQAECLISRCSVEQLTRLGLSAPVKTPPPSLNSTKSLRRQLELIQEYINHFGYNYCPGYHCDVSKKRSFAQLMQTAKNIMLAELPVKCIEAVFIAMHLTAGTALDRFTLSFKTSSQGQLCRHIVLVVRDSSSSCFGSLGISRKAQLMFKDLAFNSLGALVQDFIEQYAALGHKMIKISLSLLLPRDIYNSSFIGWNCCIIMTKQIQSITQLNQILNDYMDQLPVLTQRFENTGVVPKFISSEIKP